MNFAGITREIFTTIKYMRYRRHLKRGLKIGKNVFLGSNVLIDPSYPWLISIGDDCTITSRVMLLAHDASMTKFTGYTKVGSITIGNRVYIGVGSIILPGVHIGNDVIIGAGSLVAKDVPNNSVAVGSPVRIIKSLDKYLEETGYKIENSPIFSNGWTIGTGITDERKITMHNLLKETSGYISLK